MVTGFTEESVSPLEQQLVDVAALNEKLAPEIETVCLMTSQEHSFLSASIVRELALHHSPKLHELVPPHVAAALDAVYGVGAPAGAGGSDRSDV